MVVPNGVIHRVRTKLEFCHQNHLPDPFLGPQCLKKAPGGSQNVKGLSVSRARADGVQKKRSVKQSIHFWHAAGKCMESPPVFTTIPRSRLAR